MRIQTIWLLRLTVTGVILTAAAEQKSYPIAKSGCQDKCGNVNIPYPFGTTKDCFYNQDFLITCNHIYDPPKAFLGDSNISVTIITVKGKLRIMQYIAQDCYKEGGKPAASRKPSPFLEKFIISHTDNKFIAVGCDTIASVTGKIGENMYAVGCLSVCNRFDYASTNGTCSGIGCCQTSIPKGANVTEITITSYNNHTKVLDFNPCSYAFVVEEGRFNFTSSSFRDLQNVEYLPAVLDWAIGNYSCEVAEKRKDYACEGNSRCIEINNGAGYRCECIGGYEGNPYLPGGCRDIHECKDSRQNNCKPSKLIEVVVGICTCLALLVIAGTWSYWGLERRKLIRLKENFFRKNGGLMLQKQLSRMEGTKAERTKIFTSEELEKATKSYDESRIVGHGGFGTVYRGILSDGQVVAIKKSKAVHQSQIEQFVNEVIVLSQINHRNVVKLLGCCLETEVPLLVYEFVTNGTLFDHIHNKSKSSALPWETRLRIATETAGVLSYLHSSASEPIIHRDIKSTNILLDESYTAKVSDFGASRLVPLDQEGLSTMVQGTLGYLDPEYLQTSQLTEKSDVYSFGVVLVELLTGQKALSFDRPEEEKYLAMYFVSALKENRLAQILDDCVRTDANPEELNRVASLAGRCIRVEGAQRPTMKEAAIELEGLRLVLKHPWIDDEPNLEGKGHLLGESSDTYYGGS